MAERLLDGLSALTLLSCLIIAAVLLLWFLLRKKPLSEAAGLRHCSGWTVGFCAFGAVGLYVLVSLVLALLPESWMEEYGKAMRLSTETGLIPALAVVAGAPLAEELVFRGVIQSRLERAMPVWIAIVLQAVLFGFIHGEHPAHDRRARRVQRNERPAGAFGRFCGEVAVPCRHGRRMRGGLRALPPRFERTKNSAGGRSKVHIADGLRGDHRITEKAPFKESSLKGALRFCD